MLPENKTAEMFRPRRFACRLLILSYDGPDQFGRGYSLATLLLTLPIRPQMLPPSHCFREAVFANVSQRFELTSTAAQFNSNGLIAPAMRSFISFVIPSPLRPRGGLNKFLTKAASISKFTWHLAKNISKQPGHF